MILFVFIEFFILNYAALLFCEVLQSIIRTILSAVFIVRCLKLYDMTEQTAKLIMAVYLCVLVGFYLAIISTMFLKNGGVTCDPNPDWQEISLLVIDSLQTICIITTAILSRRKSN